jgi:hypothetical protein
MLPPVNFSYFGIRTNNRDDVVSTATITLEGMPSFRACVYWIPQYIALLGSEFTYIRYQTQYLDALFR